MSYNNNFALLPKIIYNIYTCDVHLCFYLFFTVDLVRHRYTADLHRFDRTLIAQVNPTLTQTYLIRSGV